MLWVKVYRARGHVVLAMCDEALLGREFREGDVVLRVTESYYKGELVDRERARVLAEEADIIGAVGEEAFTVLLDLGYVEEGMGKRVAGTIHVNVYKI